MAKTRAQVLPPHAMRLMMLQCVASGLGAHEFGRRNGMSFNQASRLAKLIKNESIAAGTNRTTSEGSIIPKNAAKSISVLSNRMINGLLTQGQRAIEVIERLNIVHAPQPDGSHIEWSSEDRASSRWASDICWRIITLSRKDGRDEAPATVDAATIEPIQRVMEGAPPGMLTVVSDESDGVQPIEGSA